MATRLTLHSQLSSIIETMAKSLLGQICKLVDDEASDLRLQLARLLVANSNLADKVNNLERKLSTVRRETPASYTSQRTVGVQTDCDRNGDATAAACPTIVGIFGKEWCMNLWKDNQPSSQKRSPEVQQSSEKTNGNKNSEVTLFDQMTDSETKEKDSTESTTSRCQQATSSKEELEANMAVEPEQLQVSHSVDSSICNKPLEQGNKKFVSPDGTREASTKEMSFSDTKKSPSTYVIPIEEDDDDDDDVQFVEESKQELTMSPAGEPSHNKQQTSPSSLSESSSAPDKDSLNIIDYNMVNVETTGALNQEQFSCQICSRTFFYKSTLTQHMRSHKSNFCSICKQHFPHKKLTSHTCVPSVRSPSVSRSCEQCGKTFANLSALRIHQVVHTGEKPHRCSLCGKSFTQKGNLNCHLRIHTGEKPFPCVTCGKTFTQKSNLEKHLTSHRNQGNMEKDTSPNVAE